MKKRVIHSNVEKFFEGLEKSIFKHGKDSCFVYYNSPFLGIQTPTEIHCCAFEVLTKHYNDDADKFLVEMRAAISKCSN